MDKKKKNIYPRKDNMTTKLSVHMLWYVICLQYNVKGIGLHLL